MKVIHKYEVTPLGRVTMPMGAEILSVGVQSILEKQPGHAPETTTRVVAWALVDDAAPTVQRRLFPLPTGVPLGDYPPLPAQFVGTVQLPDGLVFHIFDAGEISSW